MLVGLSPPIGLNAFAIRLPSLGPVSRNRLQVIERTGSRGGG